MSTPERILKLLAHNNLSCREISLEIDVSLAHIRSAVSKLKKAKKIYVWRYRRDEDGGRLYPRAIYAFGNGRDATPPGALSDTEYNRRHRENQRGAVNSVFMLGVPVHKRKLGRKSL